MDFELEEGNLLSDGWHRLINKNTEELLGDCSICGPEVKIKRSSQFKPDGSAWWRCNNQYKQTKDLIERPYIAHKKDYCENTECTSTIIHSVQLSVDHIDGNHQNNDPENLMTLCLNCHSHKTWVSNDYVKKPLI